MATKHDPLSEGDPINDRYQLIGPIARGGMATVWRARDRRLGRDVAVKALDPRLSGDADATARLHIEAQALAQLNHPHIAAIHDVGASFLVMELADGVPLSAVAGRLPWRAAVQLIAQTADALAAAHARGIVHRDVTAANVLLTRRGAKLVDFGICALNGDNDTADDSRMMGTTAYLAPERLDGVPVDPALDVYALGVLAHLTLTGRLPWPVLRPSEEDILGVRHRSAPQTLDVPGLAAEAGETCLRCLADDPRQRPTAAQISAALTPFAVPDEDWQTLLDRAAGPAPLPPVTFTGPTEVKELRRQHRSRRPRRRHRVAALAGVIAAAAVAWLATGWTPSPSTPPQAIGPAVNPAVAAPAQLACHVGYEVTHTDGGRFTAIATVTNHGTKPIPAGWRLRFALPQEQWIHPTQDHGWGQDGSGIASAPNPVPLRPGEPLRLTLSGSYLTNSLPPHQFRLNDQPCTATVITAPPVIAVPVLAHAPDSNETRQAAAARGGKPESRPRPDNNARAGGKRR